MWQVWRSASVLQSRVSCCTAVRLRVWLSRSRTGKWSIYTLGCFVRLSTSAGEWRFPILNCTEGSQGHQRWSQEGGYNLLATTSGQVAHSTSQVRSELESGEFPSRTSQLLNLHSGADMRHRPGVGRNEKSCCCNKRVMKPVQYDTMTLIVVLWEPLNH